MPRKQDLTRFVVDHVTGCHLWQGHIDKAGYGKVFRNSAHRACYVAAKGPVPAGLHLDHLCRTPRCVNPEHLEPVTNKVNILRGVSFSAVNARKTHCSNGHPFDDANTYSPPRGGRTCRACNLAAVTRLKRRGAA